MSIDLEPTLIVSWKDVLLGSKLSFEGHGNNCNGQAFKAYHWLCHSVKQSFESMSTFKIILNHGRGKWPWTMELNPFQPFLDDGYGMDAITGLLGYLYNKKILEEIGGLIVWSCEGDLFFLDWDKDRSSEKDRLKVTDSAIDFSVEDSEEIRSLDGC
ncbi:hypothetical protein PVK06_011159 [Gossypium arboreum]|uniref:Uncharacterized protein n=1 Tax=Gossypium arboreum TaxID=29729 RepID=A0ABR0Q889_GOSAR|nr:hypothetical protein PVK06_011159 [Gossypium arboreum]